jgi:NADH:ubiquinone oxidoreductase subunit F (NADH-binding)
VRGAEVAGADVPAGAAYHVVNKDYIRLTTMENMAMDQFARQEVLGLNLGGWIIDGPGTRSDPLHDY